MTGRADLGSGEEMDWQYYVVKGLRAIFWIELCFFLLFSLFQLATTSGDVLVWAAPLALIFGFAPALITFLTVVGKREREYEDTVRKLRKKDRERRRRTVQPRSRGQRRR